MRSSWPAATHRYIAPGGFTKTVSYSFTDVAAGFYSVASTWVEHANRATNATYQVLVNGTPLTTLAVNQRLAPNAIPTGGFTAPGDDPVNPAKTVKWGYLNQNFAAPAGATVTVTLRGATTGYTIADAVRLDFLPALQAAGAAPARLAGERLTAALLAPIVTEAKARWRSVGLSAEKSRLLDQVSIVVGNLAPGLLGYSTAAGRTIRIDDDAAGFGWFIDRTPSKDEEFGVSLADGARRAALGSRAYGKMDLLTAVMHELGHRLGLLDHASALGREGLMAESLASSTRRVPQATAAKAHDALLAALSDWSPTAGGVSTPAATIFGIKPKTRR